MWDSYQAILATRTEQGEAINQFLYNNIEHPCVTRMLGNEANTNEGNIESDGEDNGDDMYMGYAGDDGGGGGGDSDGVEGNTAENI
jgi:hypothetical protein